jgi:hypothetical protein
MKRGGEALISEIIIKKCSNLHSFYSSPNIITIIKKDNMGTTCSTHGGEEEYVYDVRGKLEKKEEATRKK